METPVHVVSSFDHAVTQWMSTVGVSARSASHSSHLQETGSSIAPLIWNVHASSGVCGVDPADRTGKSANDVLARWDAGAVDERAMAPETT